MEATRQAFTPDSITITRREDGKWDAVAVVTGDDGRVGQVKFTLCDARFTLEAFWAPSRSYIWDLCQTTEPPRIVSYEFAMASWLQPVTEPDGRPTFLEMRTIKGACNAAE